jgi:hypothetical protein
LIGQLPDRGFVSVAAFALVEDFAIPLETVLLEGAQNLGGATRHHPRGVQVFDSQQPACTVSSRVEITADRGYQRAKM